jgi:hypothetical protein
MHDGRPSAAHACRQVVGPAFVVTSSVVVTEFMISTQDHHQVVGPAFVVTSSVVVTEFMVSTQDHHQVVGPAFVGHTQQTSDPT